MAVWAANWPHEWPMQFQTRAANRPCALPGRPRPRGRQRRSRAMNSRWCAVRTAATGTDACTTRRAPRARWPCTAVHAMRCSCGLLAGATWHARCPKQPTGVAAYALRCWNAVAGLQCTSCAAWGSVGGCFQRTPHAVNFYYFRSSVHLLAPCTRRRARRPRARILNIVRTTHACIRYVAPSSRII
jgi:hypothetical protein